MPALALLLIATFASFDDKLEVIPGQAPDRGGMRVAEQRISAALLRLREIEVYDKHMY